MSLSNSRARRKRLLPGAFEAGLKRLMWFGAGAGLVAGALAGWLSLASWSIHDPSLNHATRGAAENLFASWGAVTADLAIQSLGLAAITLFLPPAAWGWRVMTNTMPAHARLRLVTWPFAVLLIAGGLACLPEPGSWPLPNGLGGIMGDLVLALARLFLPLPAVLLHLLGAVAFLFAGGWAVLYAAAVPPGALRRLWRVDGERTAAAVSAAGAAAGRGVLRLRDIAETFAPERREAEDPLPDIDTDKPARKERVVRRPADEPEVDPAGRIEPFFESVPPAGEPEVDDEAEMDDGPGAYRITRLDEDEDAPPRRRGGAGPKRAPAAASPAYALPPLRLLRKPPAARRETSMSDEELQENARMLEEVLADFGVKGEIVNVRPGPVVTLYELEPAPGTKSSRVIGLADDIARSMSAVAARVAVVPGRNAIGIELPNEQRQMVYLRELMEADDFQASEAELGLALGKNIGGEAVTVDLARMPHLLIAGTTGSGKSVGINTMILSLLYRYTPDECKFIMIDPKMLELSVYDGIPHLLSPVVTDPKKAIVALKWTVKEMEERYKRMSKVGVRNIHGYNARVQEARERGEMIVRTVQTGFDRETGEAVYEQEEMDYEPMPYLVVVVDEMADLMMVAGKDIEGAVQRLAQMARAAGIHLITATQRPSVDVVTGTIKANFPTRVSFQVTSKVDSRTILGEQGAEQLLGQGDMLYMVGGGRIMRVHGPFVSDDEVEKIVRYLKKQGAPQYLEEVTSEDEEMDVFGGGSGDPDGSGEDLFDQAVGIVIRDQKASTSYIQRRLSIGYNRAATLIERMEQEGIVSPANHAGKREILAGANN